MDINTIWTIMSWIVYGFEIFGFGVILTWMVVVIFNPGANKTVDKIRNYMFMLDEEDL